MTPAERKLLLLVAWSVHDLDDVSWQRWRRELYEAMVEVGRQTNDSTDNPGTREAAAPRDN